MKNMKLLAPLLGLLAAAIGLAVVFGPLGIGAGHLNRTKLEVRLNATDADPLASGKTKWELRLNSDLTIERQRTSTQVEDVSTTGAHEVKHNGLSVGMFVEVDALGFGDLNLDTRNGDTVIDMAIGDLIEVLNPDGVVILSGLLADKDDDTPPGPTNTAGPSATPGPTNTPGPSETPGPTDTPGATNTPDGATNTPEPSATP